MSETTDTTTAGNNEPEDLKPSQKFPDVPRLFSVSELAKVLDLAPGTIANNVLADNAPAPDFIVGERMVWTGTEVWETWVRERAEAKERKARERAEKEAASVKEFAAKISGSAKSELLKALLASMSPEEIAALGQ